MYRTHVLILAATLALGAPVIAQHGAHGRPSDLTGLARAAERVVVATVTRVEPVFQRNEHGDELIVSRTHLRVDTVLKGNRPHQEEDAVVVEIEGGTIGDLTLDVSDLPALERGERAVLFLSKNARGANVPQGRGEGILKLDPTNRVTGTGLTLAEVRAAVERGR